MRIDSLAGNLALKRQLNLQTARRGLSHAFILSGPAGSGKRTLAGLLAAALVCTRQEEEIPCGVCPACRKAAAGIHPDIIRVGDDGKDIKVEQIRALRTDAYIRPNEAARKVYLVENAHTMNQSAQNALLKLLEEGPAYAAFLLLTENAAALLPTVRSRCEVLPLSPVPKEEAVSYLRGRFPDLPTEAVTSAAARCEGLLGRAVGELTGTSAGDEEIRGEAILLLNALSERDEQAFLERTVALEKWDRDKLSSLLDELVLLLREALVLGAGGAIEQDPERRACALRAAEVISPRSLLSAVDLSDKLRTACGFYVGAGHLCGWLSAALFTAI